MSNVMEFYQQQAQQATSSVPWLAQLQHDAMQDFARFGFPLRQHEEWKYTLMDSFLEQRFNCAQPSVSDQANRASEVPVGQALFINNGQVVMPDWLNDLPVGVIIMPLLQAINQHPQIVQTYFNQLLHHEHAFHALNSALINSGLLILLPREVHIEQPIVINHWQDESDQALYVRHLIIAEPGAQATIIDHYQGAAGVNYLTNTITELFLAEQAKINHYHIQRESKQAYHFGHVQIQQAQASQFASHSLSLGAQLARSDITINLEQGQAHSLLNGIYMPSEQQHIDHHTTINHQVGHCHSEQDYRGILMGKGRAVFNGKVIVAKDAQKTQANQQNKNLLLSKQAEIDTKPQLEIFADDVICTHGATVGQLDEDALFYLAARGIGREEATTYLIQAFAGDNLRRISNEILSQWMAVLINQQLRG